jgi:hypothetical protein
MKDWIVGICMMIGFSAILVSGCAPSKNSEIAKLKLELAQQQGTRAAELEFAEAHVSMYLGCKTIFNLCTPEASEQAEKLMKNGFTGSTSVWYWFFLLAKLVCVAGPLGTFWAVLFTVTKYLHLKLIEPKSFLVAEKIHLISTVDERVKAANLRGNAIEKAIGILRRERHELTHPTRVKRKPIASPELVIEPMQFAPAPAAKPLPKREEDF